MDFHEKLLVLRKAVTLGCQNRLQEALRAFLEWLGAERGGVYRWKDDKWEISLSAGNLPQALPSSIPVGEQPTKLEIGALEVAGEGPKVTEESWWAIKVSMESNRPTYLFLAIFPKGSSEVDETALKISAELIASWVSMEEVIQSWEYLARTFRVTTLGELVSGIAHEICNPLQVIIGNAELILDTEELKERTRESLMDIFQAARQIHKIIRALVQFTDALRAEERELLDFNQVVSEAAQLAAYSLARNGVQVVLELPTVPSVWARRGDLERIVIQLVRNAGEAIVESGKGSKVIVRTGVRDKWVRLEVEDDGPGIHPELRDRIFEPFVTTRAERGGTGLGLAIVKNLVANNNGRIWLEDSPSGGAKFILELPAW